FAKDPTDTMEVFKFTDTLLDSSTPADRQRFSEILLRDPRGRALFESNNPDYLRKPFDVDALMRLAPGSLGREYATFLKAREYQAEFFASNQVSDAGSYFSLRLRKTHDLYHVVTGFDTDVPGEIGLQGFYIGQMHLPIPLSIMTSAMLNIVNKRDP